MHVGRVHRLQATELSFSDDEFDIWKKANPTEPHTHERYVEMGTAIIADIDSMWDTYDLYTVGIFFSRDEE